jgi:hypothetical protein
MDLGEGAVQREAMDLQSLPECASRVWVPARGSNRAALQCSRSRALGNRSAEGRAARKSRLKEWRGMARSTDNVDGG